jgi:shikimate dehydrogenase
MHEALLSEIGQKGCYVPFEREEIELEATIAAMQTLGFCGFNVTLPFKEKIIEYLDELSPQAEFMSAVNTVHNKDGRLIGYNTDGIGFYLGLKNSGFQADNTKVLIFGAGGAARGVAVNLLENQLSELVIFNRTLEKAERLREDLRRVSEKTAITCLPLSQNGVQEQLADADLIVNTTALGMWPDVEAVPFRLGQSAEHLTVYDLVYNPLETAFLKQARSAGAKVIDGLDMFIFQGVEALRIWLQRERIDFNYSNIRTFLLERLQTYGKH